MTGFYAFLVACGVVLFVVVGGAAKQLSHELIVTFDPPALFEDASVSDVRRRLKDKYSANYGHRSPSM